MSLIEVKWNPDRRELQQFSVLCTGIFGVMGAISLWGKHSPTAATIFWAVSAFGMVGYFVPRIVRPLYVVWMALALPIGWTVFHLLLLTVFYLVLTPIGLLMRLFGRDPLNRTFDRSIKSYWTPHVPDAEPSRYFKQY